MFATVWYAGVVMLSLGFSEMTSTQCSELKQVMEQDIYNAYQDPEKKILLIEDGYVYEQWKVTCEPRPLK